MMQKKDGIPRARNGIQHLHAHPPVARAVGSAVLDARPEIHPGGLVHAVFDDGWLGRGGDGVVDAPVDAVVVDDVARADRVGVSGEGAGLDAVVAGRVAVAAEGEVGVGWVVQEDGLGEVARVEGFVPVGLGARVAAFVAEGFLVGGEEEAVEGEELALYFQRGVVVSYLVCGYVSRFV